MTARKNDPWAWMRMIARERPGMLHCVASLGYSDDVVGEAAQYLGFRPIAPIMEAIRQEARQLAKQIGDKP